MGVEAAEESANGADSSGEEVEVVACGLRDG